MIDRRSLSAIAMAIASTTAVTACGSSSSPELQGRIRVDGSSAVAPLTRALARRFERQHPEVEVGIGESGAEQGFKKLCRGEVEIDESSRAMLPAESRVCEAEGTGFAEAAVANQAVVVLRNPRNPQTCIRIEQLAQIWRPEKPISRWTQVVNGLRTFPATIERFGSPPSSPTFDYFTEVVNGKEGRQTRRYVEAGDDEARTATRVARSEGGIGYLGLSSFSPGAKGVDAEEVESEKGICVPPSEVSVQDGSYSPLGRELLLYPSADALDDAAAKAFLTYYTEHAGDVAESVGLVPLGEAQREKSEAELRG